MNSTVLSLVFFTLLAQMCVGAFVLQEFLIPYRLFDRADISKLKSKLLGTLLLLIILAVGLSFFHLGKPLHAVFSLDNIQTSWLSREILMLSVFAILLFVYTIAFKKIRGNKAWLKILGILGMIAGILLIFIMSRIYSLPTIPAWDSLATPAEFFNAGFLLGALLLLRSMKKVLIRAEAVQDTFLLNRMKMLLSLVSVLLVTDLLISFYEVYGKSSLWDDVELILLLIKALFHLLSLFLVFPLYRSFNRGQQQSVMKGLSLIIFLVIAAEIIGRYAFYISFEGMGK